MIYNCYEQIKYKCDLQFSFKLASSTSTCSAMVKKHVILYVWENNVFGLLWDASKAFDKVKYYKPFNVIYNNLKQYFTFKLLVDILIINVSKFVYRSFVRISQNSCSNSSYSSVFDKLNPNKGHVNLQAYSKLLTRLQFSDLIL